jgi:hypothetical protein
MAKVEEDNKTIDMHPSAPSPEPVKRGRGRPVTGTAMTDAERQKKRRERLKAEGMQVVTLVLPAEVVGGLKAFTKHKDISPDSVVARLLKTQLLRPR